MLSNVRRSGHPRAYAIAIRRYESNLAMGGQRLAKAVVNPMSQHF
jgi:hypothetical protein